MDYKQLAAVILEKVGGKENVDKVLHCATRLRFTLKDVDKADTDALKKTKGVLSVINAGGQYQVVIGPDVPQVYQEVVALGNFEIAKPVDAPADEPKKKQSKLSSVLEYIASMFQPIIPAITGAGLLKALMALGTVTGLLDSASQTYIILNAIADSAFYFLPILLGSSAAKTFKCNQYVAMALGGVLVYPGFVDLINAAKDAGTSVSLFGLPVTLASYSSSVVPILLGVWFMSVIEHAAGQPAGRRRRHHPGPGPHRHLDRQPDRRLLQLAERQRRLGRAHPGGRAEPAAGHDRHPLRPDPHRHQQPCHRRL